jgi:hypothetical protein
LFVPQNLFDCGIEMLLLSVHVPVATKMRGKIATPSTETCTATSFAFRSGRVSRERIDGLRRRKMTNDFVRNVGFDVFKRVTICTLR